MNSSKPFRLYYDLIKKSWFIKKRRSEKAKLYYWGANHALLPSTGSSARSFQPSFSLTSTRYHSSKKKAYIGPLIGIMAAKGEKFPFTGNRKNFLDLIMTGKKRGAILYVFTPDQINWVTETIRGWIYHSDRKKWQIATFPFPNVIYNRVSTREKEASPDVQQAINGFQRYGSKLTLFNPHFFNKHDIFQLLKSSKDLKGYLPDTQPLISKNDLVQMLQKHKTVYLKPTKGKAGLGIIKISRSSQTNNFIFTSQKNNQIINKVATTSEKMWRLFQKNRSSSPYIIQQAIDLETIDGNPFDFRVLVQKNKQGKWDITGVGARVAGKNSITTHVPRGGKIESSIRVLEQAYPSQGQHVLKSIHQLGLSIAKEIESSYNILGEMSMDIGLDKKGKLWFFEANSKPMKFDEPSIRSQSLINLIDYFKHLTFNK